MLSISISIGAVKYDCLLYSNAIDIKIIPRIVTKMKKNTETNLFLIFIILVNS
jgi:hypothetical protein